MASTLATPRERTSPSARPPHGRIFNHEMFELVTGTIYIGLMTNVMIVVACLPLVVMLFTTDPRASWPALALLAPLAAPALVSAFGVFRDFSVNGSKTAVRTFWRTWWRHLRRSSTIGVGVTIVGVIAGLNLQFLWTTDQLGAAFIPVQVVLLALAAATALVGLVAVLELPECGLLALLRTSLVLGVRRWYVTAPSLVVLGLLGTAVVERPAVGLGLASAPLIFVAWATCRFALRSVLAEDPQTAS